MIVSGVIRDDLGNVMKTIGVIGGLSWESTALYYRYMNEGIRARLGGLHSMRILILSLDFAEIAEAQHAGDWEAQTRILTEAARDLARAGADALLIASNTMHKLAEEVERASGLPLLHIVDPTAKAALVRGSRRPALLGTRFTMEDGFIRDRLLDRHGLEPMIPDEVGRAIVHRVIYDELCVGVVRDESRAAYLGVIAALRERGADSVILGCTEIASLIRPGDVPDLPILDTTRLHAEAAVEYALA